MELPQGERCFPLLQAEHELSTRDLSWCNVVTLPWLRVPLQTFLRSLGWPVLTLGPRATPRRMDTHPLSQKMLKSLNLRWTSKVSSLPIMPFTGRRRCEFASNHHHHQHPSCTTTASNAATACIRCSVNDTTTGGLTCTWFRRRLNPYSSSSNSRKKRMLFYYCHRRRRSMFYM